jgi:integral membrane protein
MTEEERDEDLVQLRWMRRASLFEGGTLVLLVAVGMPLKHLAGLPQTTAILGPIHGMAFLLYFWMLIRTVSGGGWPWADTLRMVVAAFIPFGAFLNGAVLDRRRLALAATA